MSIHQNPRFTGPSAAEAVQRELEQSCAGRRTGLNVTRDQDRAHGTVCLPGGGAVGVWAGRLLAPGEETWTGVVFYTAQEGAIYVEEITGVRWDTFGLVGQAAAWHRAVRQGSKEAHRAPSAGLAGQPR